MKNSLSQISEIKKTKEPEKGKGFASAWIVGRLAADPEYTIDKYKSGEDRFIFPVEVPSSIDDQRVNFHRIVGDGGGGGPIKALGLKKGDWVHINGYLENRVITKADGTQFYSTAVEATHVKRMD